MTTEQKLREALQIAAKHLVMDAFELSYPEEADLIRAALAQPAEGGEVCRTCESLARTVMMDQSSHDQKPAAYGIRQITDDESVEEWEDIRTSPDVAREEADDMMATGRGERYEVVPLYTTPPASQESCKTCNGVGLFGGHMQDGSGYGEGCPDCNPEPASQEQAQQPAACDGGTCGLGGYCNECPQVDDINVAESLTNDTKAQAQAQELPTTVHASIHAGSDPISEVLGTTVKAQELPDERALPPLPEQKHFPGWAPIPYYTADQMREYARAALAAKQERKPMTDEQIRSMCKQSWVFETVKQWVRSIEAHHGIVE